MEHGHASYLESRKLLKRWSGPLPVLVNLLFILVVFYATWWIFQDPRGYFRLYTPYVGYNYTRWLLIVLIWIAYIFDFWPFQREWLSRAHPLVKGTILTLLSTAVLLLLIKGFFEGLLGNFAMAYFNPAQLTKLPGVTAFFAEEYAATACLMFAAIASWLSPSWIVAMEAAPWQDMKQPARGLSIWVMTFLLSTIVYFMTMHSHMGILYYPWQYFTAITPPYWEQFANTVAGNFHIAWIMCCTVVVWLVETIWERYPFSAIKNPWARRLSLFFAIIAISLGLAALPFGVPLFAFLGAVLTVTLVFSIGKTDSNVLLLAGVIVNAFFSAVILFFLAMSRSADLHSMTFWLMGDLGLASPREILLVSGTLAAGFGILYFHARALNLLATGEPTALHLGIAVERTKGIVFLAGSLVTAVAVAFSGIIGFVGLIIPHMIRMLFGADHRLLFPASALFGGAYLMAADTVARILLSSTELPVGVVTALCGAPYFIYLLRRKGGF